MNLEKPVISPLPFLIVKETNIDNVVYMYSVLFSHIICANVCTYKKLVPPMYFTTFLAFITVGVYHQHPSNSI